MGLFKDAPDPPDYTPIAEASEEQSQRQWELAMDQLQFSKDQWAEQKAMIDEVMANAKDIQGEQWANAQADRQFYEQTYRPMEQEYLEKARDWASPERIAAERGRAQADVAANFEAQRQNALQRLESYGVDPGQTRNAALDIGVRTAQATEMARAANAAGLTAEREGLGMMGESINVGRGMASQGLQYAGQAMQADVARQNAGSAWQGAAGAMGSPTQWSSQSANSLGNWANALGSQFNAELGAFNASNQWGLAGMAQAGLGAAAGAYFAEGGEASAIPMDGEGAVSGPGGPKDDAIPARLSDGEYVIPTEVVRRKGTEFFDKLVTKVQDEERQRHAVAGQGDYPRAIPPDAAVPGVPPNPRAAVAAAAGGEVRAAINL